MKNFFNLILVGLACASMAFSATKPFKVLAYSGYRDGQGPGGAQPTRAQVKEDLLKLLPYTFGIRIYALGGYQADIPAICDEIGLEVHVGVWLDNDDAANQKAMDDAIMVIKEGHPSIKSVLVGNEYLLRQEVTFKNNLAASEAKLIGYIDYVKTRIPAGLPVGTAEPYWWWIKTSRALWEKVDIIYWQVHPWWDNQSIAGSVPFVTDLHNKVRAKITSLNLTNPNKRDIISETGWPTAISHGAAVGSLANQQTYIQKLHAWAVPANMEYWYFCPFDELWKDEAGGVGPHWGMWNSDRTPKDVITNLDLAIPLALRYTQGSGPTAISKPLIFPSMQNVDKINVTGFNVQGQELDSKFPSKKGFLKAYFHP
jgi:exo-beta-1,3-glucanase (GH17 family)